MVFILPLEVLNLIIRTRFIVPPGNSPDGKMVRWKGALDPLTGTYNMPGDTFLILSHLRPSDLPTSSKSAVNAITHSSQYADYTRLNAAPVIFDFESITAVTRSSH